VPAPAYKKKVIRRSDPLTSVLLVFPLFIAYQIGVLALPQTYNGADLITSGMLRLLHGNSGTYLLINSVLAVLFLVLVLVLRKKNTFDPRLFLPVLLESAIYALTMGSLICFVMIDFLHIDPKLAIACAAGPEQASPIAKVVLSLGAGVHEELVFRLIMVGGGHRHLVGAVLGGASRHRRRAVPRGRVHLSPLVRPRVRDAVPDARLCRRRLYACPVRHLRLDRPRLKP
jgi:hypothetical protein